MNTGINFEASKSLASGLGFILADTYSLYLKTQNYHWNIEGEGFYNYHMMFEDQYKSLATAIDEIAERIRALGQVAPGSFNEFSKLTSIDDGNPKMSPQNMVRDLCEGHETISRKAREVIDLASRNNDEATTDLLASRMMFHEKTSWMLKSSMQ